MNPGFRRRETEGFTLTEMAIVLGIISLVLGAIWAAANQVMANKHISDATTEITQIVQGTRAVYADTTPPVGGLMPSLINANVIPSTMVTTSCAGLPVAMSPCALSPWNGEVTMSSQTGWWGGSPINPQAFEIVFWNMPGTTCIELMSQLIESAPTNGLLWAYSDDGGAFFVTNAITASSPQITNCGGKLVFQFHV